jgi:hypothetical protein
MTFFGKVIAVFMVIWLSFCALWLFDVLPKEQIKELASLSLESMIQLVSWLKMKVASLLDSAVQKFFG